MKTVTFAGVALCNEMSHPLGLAIKTPTGTGLL